MQHDDMIMIAWSIVSEPFELPHGATWGYLFANGALALAFNLCFMTTIALTSPLMASVGGMLAIPISGIVDYISHGDTFGPIALVGSTLIIAGFVCLTYAEFRHMQPSAINSDTRHDQHAHHHRHHHGGGSPTTYGSLSSHDNDATVVTPS